MTRTAGSAPYIGLVASCNFGNPIQTGRVRVRPKPDLTRPVDSSSPDRISCNLQIKPLFLYSSKCCETTSITTICVLEFVKTTPSILIHKI